jgi:hypothetical protein
VLRRLSATEQREQATPTSKREPSEQHASYFTISGPERMNTMPPPPMRGSSIAVSIAMIRWRASTRAVAPVGSRR